MEKYVCNKELSEKLQKLGVKQESEFYWNKLNNVFVLHNRLKTCSITPLLQESISAFTTGELGEVLPYCVGQKMRIRIHEYFLTIDKLALGYWAKYENGGKYLFAMTDKSLANCLAKMLIYLLENKLINKTL